MGIKKDRNDNTEFWQGIREVIRLYEKMLKPVCAKHGLTLTEADVISFLKNNPGRDTAAEVAELRRLSKAAVSKGVEALIGKSLLERQPDRVDRRKVHLKIKAESGPVLERIASVQDEFWKAIFEGFTDEELEEYARFRKRILDNARQKTERREQS